jgi:co-chaperonin GroES (HSP10)
MTPANPYFLVRSSKQQEQEKRTKMGFLSIPQSHVYMDRNTQYAEVIAISEVAHECFKEVETGDILLLHHFCQSDGKDSNEEHLVAADENYNYYVVSPKDHNGKRNEVYGVYKNGEIITHPDFLLLEIDQPEAAPLEFEKVGNLEVVKEWHESREEKSAKMQSLQKQIQHIAGKTDLSDSLKRGIEDKEADLAKISKQLNKMEYLPFQIASFHPSLNEKIKSPVSIGDTLYCLNIAVNTLIEFMGKTYRTVALNYVALSV